MHLTGDSYRGKGKRMANFITGCRILCSVLLLFSPVFSPMFYLLYVLAGFTDMVDGTVARKTGTASEFGARLDTFADMVFVLICMIKLLPVLTIPVWLCIWIGIIAVIKVLNIVMGYMVQKTLAAKHTILNKVTGAALFLFPLTLSAIDLKYSAGFICAVATLAAVQEGFLVHRESQKLHTRR